MTNIETKEQGLVAAQRLLEAGLNTAAQTALNQCGVRARIVNGRIVEENDVTEPYLEQFITADKEMLILKDFVRKLSRVDDEVLITGETGTGKELLAKALHGKRDGHVVACNAAGFPENLIESELFGHERGSFTGASNTKQGMIARAEHGTFFLDEVGELPLLAQAKLLRVLQDRKMRKVGANVDEDVKCRFVFATNKDLRDMCKRGLFRLDLFARLATFELITKPLRERLNDVKLICDSTEAGKAFYNACFASCDRPVAESFDLSLNVRSLQIYIKRFKVLGVLPIN